MGSPPSAPSVAQAAEGLGRGAVYMLIAALAFAAMSAAVKLASGLPNAVVVFARNAIALAVLLPWLVHAGWPALKTDVLRHHLVRGLAGVSAMFCFFYSIGHLGLAPAVLLNYSLPLYMPAIERAWLGEPIPRRLWPPLLLGFAGLVVVLRPGTELFHGAALVALAAGILAALAQVGVRNLTTREPLLRIVFYFSLISTLVSLPPALLGWQTPNGAELASLVAAGALGALGQVYLARAYTCAPAAQVGPFLYSIVIFSGLLDALVWGLLPDPVFFLGACLVVAAGILTLRLRGARGKGDASVETVVKPG